MTLPSACLPFPPPPARNIHKFVDEEAEAAADAGNKKKNLMRRSAVVPIFGKTQPIKKTKTEREVDRKEMRYMSEKRPLKNV